MFILYDVYIIILLDLWATDCAAYVLALPLRTFCLNNDNDDYALGQQWKLLSQLQANINLQVTRYWVTAT